MRRLAGQRQRLFLVETWRPHRLRLTDTRMVVYIRLIHKEAKGAYGSPRITRELLTRCYPASKERVVRLMLENGIHARHKRRFKVTTDSMHSLSVALNILDRNFTPIASNQVWAGDITYIWTAEVWLYLAAVIDLFNREVVGWSIKQRITSDIVTEALKMAWFRRRSSPGLIHHSDRGNMPVVPFIRN